MSGYPNETTVYRLGYMNYRGPVSSIGENGEAWKAKTIENQFDGLATFTGNGVLSEGSYSAAWSGTVAVSLTVLDAIIGGVHVETSTVKQWTGLTSGTTWYLFATLITTGSPNSLEDKTWLPVSSESSAIPANSIILARIVISADATPTMTITSDITVTGKLYSIPMAETRVNDISSTAAAMQTVTDPYPGATPAVSLPTSLAGELERLRYQVDQIIHGAPGATPTNYWYLDPPTNLAELEPLTNQQPHIVDSAANLAELTTKFNTLLGYLENLGLLATS